jgi:hypothetical protein
MASPDRRRRIRAGSLRNATDVTDATGVTGVMGVMGRLRGRPLRAAATDRGEVRLPAQLCGPCAAFASQMGPADRVGGSRT